MDSNERSEEIKLSTSNNSSRAKLGDYIPIYVPAVEKALLHRTDDREKRLLDFLKARPSTNWFVNFGFMTKRLGSLRSTAAVDSDSSSLPRFRVPFVRKVDWKALSDYCKSWAKKPINIALLVWLFFVAIGVVLLFLLMTGSLNGAIPKSSERKRWTESTNQILNALFTIMCLYQHPQITHHLILILRWRSSDVAELRKAYCKNPACGPYDRAHIFFVVSLFHLTCFAQYAYCALFWAYKSKTRPNWAVNLFMGLGLAAPIVAGLYMIYGPLGKKSVHVATVESPEPRDESGTNLQKVCSGRVVATKPVWVGGLFDFWDDLTVAYLSFFCTFCVFGWNMERLGFGNMYVHIFTFIFLCIAPFWVFNVSALSINDEVVRYIVGVIGIVLCFLGFLYGGFWRVRMRKRFKLPESRFCCGGAAASDFVRWLFCWSCSLAQEVRTGNFYDIEGVSLCERGTEEEEGVQGLEPLEREGRSGPSVKSSPPTPTWSERLAVVVDGEGDQGENLAIVVGREGDQGENLAIVVGGEGDQGENLANVVDGEGDQGENRHRMSPPGTMLIQAGR